MGKQVSFFMTVEDERAFLRFARLDRRVGILASTSTTVKPRVLDELLTKVEPGWLLSYLCDMENGPPPRMERVGKQNYFVLDSAKSEVIEISRSFRDDNWLRNGRLFAAMDYWESYQPPVVGTKSKTFQEWYRRLASWIRRTAVRKKDSYFVMPGAAKFADEGGELG